MNEFKIKIGKSGRIVIPAEYRRKLGLEPGDEIIMHLEEDGVRLYAPSQGVARAQAMVRRYVPEGTGLSKELISERREEAARE